MLSSLHLSVVFVLRYFLTALLFLAPVSCLVAGDKSPQSVSPLVLGAQIQAPSRWRTTLRRIGFLRRIVAEPSSSNTPRSPVA